MASTGSLQDDKTSQRSPSTLVGKSLMTAVESSHAHTRTPRPAPKVPQDPKYNMNRWLASTPKEGPWTSESPQAQDGQNSLLAAVDSMIERDLASED
ncbi:hypothetical protein Dda_7155 [Drechslerella dactyloides]|uniref:Uncharacterized protein n=1 Tax=Drechslerella dactyloides TaxID=74499 RepID=A0AAD6NG30_DREDA|nr:hypothetical protein Dda_7155 [Drechslerella dactyloides]